MSQFDVQETGRDDQLTGADRLEKAHQAAVQVLLAVSSHAVQGGNLMDFYRRLAETLAELVDAGKVLFWRVGDDSMLAPAGGFGIGKEFLSRLKPVRCDPSGDDLASRVVYQDLIFRANATNESPEYRYVLERLAVSSAISVPWRAGAKRFGLIAAYDSSRAGGFSQEDTWVLEKAGLAAGLVAQLWHTRDDLRKTVDRLTKVDGARQLLLKNMTTVVEKERKRFVTELHDDALQKLTAAELHLARLTTNELDTSSLEKLRELLGETESSLRRLVFDIRPPALETADGLVQSIQDRLAMLAGSGIQTEVEIDLPQDLSLDLKSLVFRQVAEAVGNAERHAKATVLNLLLKVENDGIRGMVKDNGQGFVVAERSNLPGHLGLLALRERALMAGGWYRIESQPGVGTHVEFWIPLDS